MSFLDEPVSQIISIGLECNTIIEKINKMTHKEMENMVLSSLASSGKRINPTLKKLLELESTISMLRQTLGKTNLLYISESKSKDDSVKENDIVEKEKAEKDKAEKEKAEKDKAEKDKAEKDKAEKDKAEKDKAEKDKAEKDKAKAKAEKDKAKAKAEKDKAKAKAEKENLKAKVKAEKENLKAEKDIDTKNVSSEIQEDATLKSSDDLSEPGNQKSDEPLHIRRKNIPRHVKTLVWGKYIGNDKPEALCYSCRHERIDIRNFHCGHVIAESNGGTCMLNNLRPICAPCNGSMGTMSMNEFTQTFFGWNV